MSRHALTSVTVRALNVDIRLSVDPRISTALRGAWADAEVAPTLPNSRPSGMHVCLDGCGDVYGNSVEELLHHLSPAVTQRVIAARAGELVMLHAAALADPITGATAVLVARSGTGKTTASQELGRELAYLTDETAGITFEGEVLPYRKPLSIIEAGHLKVQRSPRELGLHMTERKCHLAAMVVIERSPSHAGDPILNELETVDALAALAPEASSLGRVDLPLQRLAGLIKQVGGVRHVTYSEAATLRPVIHSLLNRGH